MTPISSARARASSPPCQQPSPSLGKLAALLAVACVGAHVLLVAGHVTTHPISSLVMTGVSAVCLPCAVHLWRRPQIRTWLTSGALAATMLALHLMPMVHTVGSGTNDLDDHHAAGHHGSLSGDLGSAPFLIATTLAVVQVSLACLAMVQHQARRRPLERGE